MNNVNQPRPEGHRIWHIPDCYLPASSVGPTPSHEAFCVLNVSAQEAALRLDFYFADRAPMSADVRVPGQRNLHLRTDQPNMVGVALPRDTPYACRIESTVPVTIQYTRLDAQEGYELMTTSAIPVPAPVD